MTESAAHVVFALTWWTLLGIALIAELAVADRPSRRRAGPVTNLLIVMPFVLVFGLSYLGRYAGTLDVGAAVRAAGAGVVALGMAGYVLSHLYLRGNWSLGASVKEGHRLVRTGPYRFMRHPMYSCMTLIVLGSGLLIGNYLIMASTLVVAGVYYLRASAEERLLERELPEYRQYAGEVRMFIPGVF